MSDIEISESYSPQDNREEDEKQCDQVYKRRVEKLTERSIQGRWTEEQNFKYVLYMDYYEKIFVSKEKRKQRGVYLGRKGFLNRCRGFCRLGLPDIFRSHFQKLMNKFKKLKRVRQYYQQELGVEEYQARLEALKEQIQRSRGRNEEKTEVSKQMIVKVAQGVQTEPTKVSLGDLSNGELIRLMNLLNQYQKIQFPFQNWPQSQFRPSGSKF